MLSHVFCDLNNIFINLINIVKLRGLTMGERKYRIICLKRSQLATKGKDDYISTWYNESNLVYWKPNRAGYTDQYSDAGVYSLQELADCAGWFGDWLIEPTSYQRDA